MSHQDLREAGLKATMPRLKILQLLEENTDRHLSAEEICSLLQQQGEDLGLATLYRVLTQFESAGLVHRHHFAGGQSVFELDQGEHHDHLVCIGCNTVECEFDTKNCLIRISNKNFIIKEVLINKNRERYIVYDLGSVN